MQIHKKKTISWSVDNQYVPSLFQLTQILKSILLVPQTVCLYIPTLFACERIYLNCSEMTVKSPICIYLGQPIRPETWVWLASCEHFWVSNTDITLHSFHLPFASVISSALRHLLFLSPSLCPPSSSPPSFFPPPSSLRCPFQPSG